MSFSQLSFAIILHNVQTKSHFWFKIMKEGNRYLQKVIETQILNEALVIGYCYYWRLFPMGTADSDKMAAFFGIFVLKNTWEPVQLHS